MSQEHRHEGLQEQCPEETVVLDTGHLAELRQRQQKGWRGRTMERPPGDALMG